MLTACGRETRYSQSFFAMDTVMFVTIYGKNAEESAFEAQKEIQRLESVFDPESPSGELYAINHAPEGKHIALSEDMCEIFRNISWVRSRTSDVLNPALYPLVKLWGFIDATDDTEPSVPSQSDIARCLELADYGSLTFGEGDTISLPDSTELTMGAIAKGYAAQRATELLDAKSGVSGAILNLGGNVQTLGSKPDKSPWVVAVRDPQSSGELGQILIEGNAAVVTSGSYERYFEQDGKIYHHILDPRSGYPAESGLLSITVVTQTGTLADALSTSLFILGEEGALAVRESVNRESPEHAFELILVTDDGRVVITDGLRDMFNGESGAYEFIYL